MNIGGCYHMVLYPWPAPCRLVRGGVLCQCPMWTGWEPQHFGGLLGVWWLASSVRFGSDLQGTQICCRHNLPFLVWDQICWGDDQQQDLLACPREQAQDPGLSQLHVCHQGFEKEQPVQHTAAVHCVHSPGWWRPCDQISVDRLVDYQKRWVPRWSRHLPRCYVFDQLDLLASVGF